MSEPTEPSGTKEQPTVKVSDRRRFAAAGEPIESGGDTTAPAPDSTSAQPPDPEPAADAAAPPASETRSATEDAGRSAGAVHLPEASLELLVISLAMQARMELVPEETDEPPNLDLARHTIDLLAVLQEKTKGNLSFEENRLLENVLTELRFRYVQAVDQINKQAKG
jgi:hypothetical protein